MKRLTKQTKKGLYDIETSKFQNVCHYSPGSLFGVFQKLGQLEDLMEKYNIEDLEALDDILLENYLNIKIHIGEIKCQK